METKEETLNRIYKELQEMQIALLDEFLAENKKGNSAFKKFDEATGIEKALNVIGRELGL